MIELWQVLKDGKVGEEYEILSNNSLNGRVIVISKSHVTNDKYIHFKDSCESTGLSSYLIESKFRKVMDFVPVWVAIEAYMKGKTIQCYNQSGNGEFKKYATYKKNDNTHNAINIFEINSYLWMIMED